MRWTMSGGMRSMLGAAEPPNAPLMTWRIELPWRRLPLTMTSVWLGLMPRKRADSEKLAMSVPCVLGLEGRDELGQRLVEVGLADLGQRLRADELDRGGAVGGLHAGGAGAGHDDFTAAFRRRLCLEAPLRRPAHRPCSAARLVAREQGVRSACGS